ncbi:MAG: TIGR03087 family PEP-CTERM/XrtA system glycosyltransferase [Parasulfuritortus sp.]|nr:TIGR03087 family PEP-CTERM/XrtA system glycosyltransferase [Parasulfuritortus sp.]
MANLLYLVHRLPYPPNKGDKVRSYNLLKYLARSHAVFLGTFVDDPDDMQYLPDVRDLCADMYVARLNPGLAKFKSLVGLLTGEALTLPYYRDASLLNWVMQTLHQQSIEAIVIFSSAMAQYVPAETSVPVLVDFVDVDSAKWTQYASQHRWPMSWVYRREGENLLAYERAIAGWANRSFFVTDNEVELFAGLAPECASRVETVMNGVDSDYFSPVSSRVSPYPNGQPVLVFTGAMDYWPNIDAVTWFAKDIFPSLRVKWPNVKFYIVGRNPTPTVTSLAGDGVVVTGTVPDVRPYLQFADVVVAPMRVARGVQNKILEAMAMARPVVAALTCTDAIGAESGRELIAAGMENEYVSAIDQLLENPVQVTAIGEAGRACVVMRYSWEAHLAKIDSYLTAVNNS